MEISVLATGGTIASSHDRGGNIVVTETVDDLLKAITVPPGVNLVGTSLLSLPSYELSPDDMLEMVRELRSLIVTGIQGVVITHGTDTMEETAYLVGQYLPRRARIVLTGAQRGSDEFDSDGRRNLTDAIRVASADCELGPVIVTGGLAIAAVEARKVHTSSLSAFSGGDAGALALVDDAGVHVYGSCTRGGFYAEKELPVSLPRVDLIKLVAGADGTHIDASVNIGAQGIVIEALGAGNATELVVAAVKRARANGVHVAITTRTGHGRVRPTYGGLGGGALLAQAGATFAGDLTGPQARMALAMSIAHESPDAVGDTVQLLGNGGNK